MGARKFETWADYLEDKGRTEGIQQGIQQGMQQGRVLAAASVRHALMKLLVKRFGAMPPSALPVLEQAGIDELGDWLERALDAPSIEALLGLPSADLPATER